jgi:hypothetical protein
LMMDCNKPKEGLSKPIQRLTRAALMKYLPLCRNPPDL